MNTEWNQYQIKEAQDIVMFKIYVSCQQDKFEP